MQLVESHIIKPTDPRYRAIDAACFASKNLYNAALYEIRQAFIHDEVYLNYNAMDKRMKAHEAYQALPAKVAQQILKLLDKNWQSFFKAIAAWREHPEQFLGRPRLAELQRQGAWAQRADLYGSSDQQDGTQKRSDRAVSIRRRGGEHLP